MRPVLYSKALDYESMINRNASKCRQFYLNKFAMESNTFSFDPVKSKIFHKLRVLVA